MRFRPFYMLNSSIGMKNCVIKLLFVTCFLSSFLIFIEAPNPACFGLGREEEHCILPKTQCSINPNGSPGGCVEESKCGSAAWSKQLKCDEEASRCCCKAESTGPCNDHTKPELEAVLCETFANATVCLMDANVEFEHNCRLADDGVETCEGPDDVCTADIEGRPRGCIHKDNCTDGFYFFMPVCDSQTGRCCCIPLAGVHCNDRTESPELDNLIKKLDDQLRMKDKNYANPLFASWKNIEMGLLLHLSIAIFFHLSTL